MGAVAPEGAEVRLRFQGKALLGGSRDPLVGGTIPAIVGEAAWQGYAACGFGEQSCARVHERGGFSLAELGYFLARAVDAGRITITINT